MKRSTIERVLIKLADKYVHLLNNTMLKMEEQELERASNNLKTNSFKQGLIEGYSKGAYNYD